MVIINKWLPIGKNFYAINLFGIIFAKGNCDKYVINHERIHSRQMLELLVIPFYLIYVVEWVIRIIMYKDSLKAYRNISFEREAYSNDSNLNYLQKRNPYSFISYLRR